MEMRPHIDEKKSPQDVDDSSDTYDTIEFLLKHVPNNNGKVGIWGISYPGFYTSASIIDSHPALVAASPQAPMTDLFLGDDAYHGGAFMLSANFGFYPFFHPQKKPQTPKPTVPFDFGTPDSYKFYLQAGNIANLDKLYLKGSNWLFNDQAKHDTYDSYWQARDLSRHMKNVHCAVLVVGGWYDAEDLSGPYQHLLRDQQIQPEDAHHAGGRPLGAWRLGARRRQPPGRYAVQLQDREYFRANIQFPFFEHYLKGKGEAQPKAVVFETGTNVWRSFDAWPPKAAAPKTLYFHAGGKLSFDPPDGSEGRGRVRERPQPSGAVCGLHHRHRAAALHGGRPALRQLPAGRAGLPDRAAGRGRDHRRADLAQAQDRQLRHGLRFRREADRRLSGRLSRPGRYPGRATSASWTRRRCTWAATSNCCAGNPSAPSSANSWEKPEPLTPGKEADINFTMPDLFHTFRRGHRIMVQVQSSWFPLTDRNPQTFTDIPNAKPEEFQKATEQVFRQKDAASGVEVLVLPNM